MENNIFEKFKGEFFENNKSDTLVLVMHGSRGRFTHNLQHSLFLNLKQKYNIFNFNFPGEISTLTMEFEISCIDEMINYFYNKYSKIILIGHSKSASEILSLQNKTYDKINKCILIAPRINLMNSQEMKIYNKNGCKEFIYPSKNIIQKITFDYINSIKNCNEKILNFNYNDKSFLIIYGLDDKVMKLENYDKFILNKKNFELKKFENCDHLFTNEIDKNKMINFISNWI